MTVAVRLIPDAEVATWKPKPDLVKGVLAAKEVNLLFAKKNRGKTFLGLDLAYSIAIGRESWLGQRITEHGSVVYSCAEGRNGLPKRRAAWLQSREPGYEGDVPTLAFPDIVIDIRKLDQVKALVDAIREQHPDVVLVVIDTLSQHMPGGDEGTADMSAALTGCQYIRDQLDTTVLALHHPTKADDTNERGGSGFRGGCADVLGIEDKQGVFWLKSLNTRDRGKDLTIPYTLDVVTLQGRQFRDDDGDQFTSCVPKALNSAVEHVKAQRHDAETDAAVLRALTTALQSARSIREKAERNDKAVRESLARLKTRGAVVGDTKSGWALAA